MAQRTAAEQPQNPAPVQQPAAPAVGDAALATTIADAVRAAVEAAFSQRAADPAQQRAAPAAPAAPAVTTTPAQPPADPVAGMRSIVQRRAADDAELLQDFDDLVTSGASTEDLGAFVQQLIGARGEDIATGTQQRGLQQPARLMSFEESTTYKRAQANLGYRDAAN